MSSAYYSSLISNRTRIRNGISNGRTRISALEGEIRRLREVSLSLKSITQGANVSIRNTNIDINESEWRGSKKHNFISQRTRYINTMNHFITQTKDSIQIIDNEIEKKQASLSENIANISGLQANLTSTQTKINTYLRG